MPGAASLLIPVDAHSDPTPEADHLVGLLPSLEGAVADWSAGAILVQGGRVDPSAPFPVSSPHPPR